MTAAQPAADLGRFRAALSGEPGAASAIVESYLSVLASRLGGVLAHDSDGDRLQAALAGVEQQDRGSIVAALAWPPVAQILLGRWQGDRPAARIAELLDSEERLSEVGEDPAVRPRVGWLDPTAPGDAAVASSSTPEDFQPAFELLRASQGADELVRFCTSVIVPRTDADPQVTGSWSTDELIGCSVLVNPTGVHDVAEAVLHEAIHHSQGMVEVVQPFIREARLVDDATRYPSPWTGAPLTAKSLLAATFVWFGLAAFWTDVQRSLQDGHAEKSWRRCASGFVAGDPARLVAFFDWALDPAVPQLVAELQQEMRDLWSSIERPGPGPQEGGLTSKGVMPITPSAS